MLGFVRSCTPCRDRDTIRVTVHHTTRARCCQVAPALHDRLSAPARLAATRPFVWRRVAMRGGRTTDEGAQERRGRLGRQQPAAARGSAHFRAAVCSRRPDHMDAATDLAPFGAKVAGHGVVAHFETTCQ